LLTVGRADIVRIGTAASKRVGSMALSWKTLARLALGATLAAGEARALTIEVIRR